ncbi:methyl-accepting chemotaxis protein, partial [Pseudomonas sp. MPR-R1B]
TGPLARLQHTMATLAAGNNAVEIPFADRTDEIGTMADTVRVFRDAALELEAAQMAKAQEDATQQMVVATVGENLGALAAGDLTATINT